MIYQAPKNETPALDLVSCLPSLVRRLDQRAVEAFEAELGEVRADRSVLPTTLESAHSELAEQHLLWRRTLRVVARIKERLRAGEDEYRRLSEQYFAQVPGGARDEVLISRLAIEAENAVAAWLDRRAVRSGLLDIDAYGERYSRREASYVARLRVGLYASEQLADDILKRLDGADAAITAAALLDDANVLFELATQTEFEDLAWLAMRVAAAPLRALFAERAPVPSRWIAHAVRTAVSPHVSSWAQRTALDVLAGDPESATELLEGRLRRRHLERDDWHVQAHCARLLGQVSPGLAVHLFDELLDSTEGDAVRIAMAQALGPIGSADAVDVLLRLGAEEQPQKVRIAAGQALARISLGAPDAARASQELANSLLSEPDADVLIVLGDEVMKLLRDLPAEDDATPKLALLLRDALGQRLDGEADTAVANQIAALRLELASLAAGNQAETELTRKLGGLGFGRSLLTSDSIDRATLSRAMAEAARRGFGLYARERRSGGFRVRRGERFRTRLWRVLHEVRNPTPSKRQGHQHTRARTFAGDLRAHPHALGEVTPTTVPGERRQVNSEGGWGPYLPLVDDVLDAQQRPIEITTTSGVTRVTPPASPLLRLRNWLRVSWDYRELDELRLASVRGSDEAQRGRFLALVRERYGTTVQFQPHYAGDPTAPGLRMLVARAHDRPMLEAPVVPPRLASSSVVIAAPAFVDEVLAVARSGVELSTQLGTELFERGGVRLRDLAVVTIALLTTFFFRMVFVRIAFDRWRAAIPLCIGGWGTRGKSGTERLKAGLFHAMGYDVFVKTTGCEAMFIHAPRRADALEIFIYRPYDKASIWEQGDMLKLGQRLQSDVFLWECMALNPRYVTILQAHWMRDDLVTLTNAYPDHEDIQGPAGIDVAETIGRFIPPKGTAITSEREMLPIFERIAHERDSELLVVDSAAELSIPDDMLDRFPYREHPRNIALVARMATELGIDREYSIFAMADRVVPDLGVLKEYPSVAILGRDVRFVNGCSANERAGFMNNWTRMQLDAIGEDPASTTQVFTVVNNRGDRISRSVVFADILVRDVAVDRHVLIGTNLTGLRNYLTDSLARFLENVTVIDGPDDQLSNAQRRLDEFGARVRIRRTSPQILLNLLSTMAAAAEAEVKFDEQDALALQGALDELSQTVKSWEHACQQVGKHPAVRSILAKVAASHAAPAALATSGIDADLGELARAPLDQVEPFFVERITCTIAHQHLHAELDASMARGDIDGFHQQVREWWRQRFWHTVHSIDDSEISGDGIILQCARNVPPGFEGVLMGTQNIKGTGLDFVYRWVDLDTTNRRLSALRSASESVFQGELLWLLRTSALKLGEALAAWQALRALPTHRRCSPRELALVERAAQHVGQLARQCYDAASSTSDGPIVDTPAGRAIGALERALDPFDAIWRRYRSEQLMRMLAAGRISHPRMAELMRKLTKRQKGGWLVAKLANKA